MYNDDTELTRDEIAALAALPRQMRPSDLLEERVVRALRADGHFGAPRRSRIPRGIRLAMRIAAAIALFAGGVATGRYLLATPAPQSAAVAAPATLQERDTTFPDRMARPAKKVNESMIAEREMWL